SQAWVKPLVSAKAMSLQLSTVVSEIIPKSMASSFSLYLSVGCAGHFRSNLGSVIGSPAYCSMTVTTTAASSALPAIHANNLPSSTGAREDTTYSRRRLLQRDPVEGLGRDGLLIQGVLEEDPRSSGPYRRLVAPLHNQHETAAEGEPDHQTQQERPGQTLPCSGPFLHDVAITSAPLERMTCAVGG